MSAPVPADPDEATLGIANMLGEPQVVAVVSDGSTFLEQATALRLVLRRYAALIHHLTALPTRVIVLDADSPEQFAALYSDAVEGMDSDVAAVFLTHTDPHRTRLVQQVKTVPVVVTDHDTTAIALTAALWTTLARAGAAPQSSRVVIAGTDTMPTLGPLLVAAGVGDLTGWRTSDAAAFPLRIVAKDADVVINLLGESPLPRGLRTDRPDLAVLTPNWSRDPLLAVPGLLRAAVLIPGVKLDVEVAHDCALALVMATPPEQDLPPGPGRALTDQVVDAVIRTLPPTARHPSGRTHHNVTPETGPDPTWSPDP